MPFYETVFIARQDLSEKQVTDLTESFCKFIKDGGGKIHKTENWGLRTLAYRIQKNRKGHYVLIESDTPAEALHEMERNMRLDENVLRYMSIKEEALSTEPSPLLRSRDDRDDSNDDKPSKPKKEAA